MSDVVYEGWMKTYDKEGFVGLTHLQLVQMRCEAVEERKSELKIETEREGFLVEIMGWNVFDKAFFLALEMVKSGAIKVEIERSSGFVVNKSDGVSERVGLVDINGTEIRVGDTIIKIETGERNVVSE
jgi:hypothetical protein